MLPFRISFIMKVYYKLRQVLLQNATAILLQNESGYLLQNATTLLQNATVITKCDVYYKLRQYNNMVVYKKRAFVLS